MCSYQPSVFIFVLWVYMWGVAKSESARRKPAGCQIRVEAAAWAGGSHEAGSETIPYDLSWFLPVECEDIWVGYVVKRYPGWGKEKRERRRSWFPTKEEHVPDGHQETPRSLSRCRWVMGGARKRTFKSQGSTSQKYTDPKCPDLAEITEKNLALRCSRSLS